MILMARRIRAQKYHNRVPQRGIKRGLRKGAKYINGVPFSSIGLRKGAGKI